MGTSSSLTASKAAAARGRRPRRGRDMRTRNGNLRITDLVGSTRDAKHLGTTGDAGPRKWPGGDTTRETQEDGSDSVTYVNLLVQYARTSIQDGYLCR
jgi:hypothetical protein